MPVFEDALSRQLPQCSSIGSQRGVEYADSWADDVQEFGGFLDAVLTQLAGKPGSDAENNRIIRLAVLCDTKLSRIFSGGPHKSDNYHDLINYVAVLCDCLERYPWGEPRESR